MVTSVQGRRKRADRWLIDGCCLLAAWIIQRFFTDFLIVSITSGRLQRTEESFISGNISFQKEL